MVGYVENDMRAAGMSVENVDDRDKWRSTTGKEKEEEKNVNRYYKQVFDFIKPKINNNLFI